MQGTQRASISLANPFVLPLLFISIGGIAFAILQIFILAPCVNSLLPLTFFFSTVLMTILIAIWAKRLEEIHYLNIKPLPSLLIWFLIAIEMYIALTLISHGIVEEPDARLAAHGSSTLIAFSTALNKLFFPICYFAARTKTVRYGIILTFIFTTTVMLVTSPSKSSVFVVFFTLLLFLFLQYKKNGKSFPFKLFSLKSALVIISLLAAQFVLLAAVFGQSLGEIFAVIIHRIGQNFDSAILGCMVPRDTFSPNHFFTYTTLSLLKRIDSSFFDLDFFNVSQWLVYEVLNISREGRYGFPNDNLFIGLFFGGFGVFTPFVFIIIIGLAHFTIIGFIRTIKRTGAVDPIFLALLFQAPILYQSTQDFFGVILILSLFKMIAILLGPKVINCISLNCDKRKLSHLKPLKSHLGQSNVAH